MDRTLTGRLRVIQLFDAYGRLLTPKQQRLLRLYYHDDLSLGEIAQRLEITRQAVFDSLKRSTDELERLEESLQVLLSRDQGFRRRQQLMERLRMLEESLLKLRDQLAPQTLGQIMDDLAALRRTV